jgi:hypothetical protein
VETVSIAQMKNAFDPTGFGGEEEQTLPAN